MRQHYGKPSKWDWTLAAGALLAGLLLLLPFVPALLREKLPVVLIPVGVGLLVMNAFSLAYYKSLPEEEQKERSRADRDERNDMIRGKAACVVLDLETGLWVVLLFVYGLYQENRDIFTLLIWVNLVRICAIGLTRWWVSRKY